MTGPIAASPQLPRAVIAGARSLDHAPLGFVLVLAALVALPSPLAMLVQLYQLGDWPADFTAVILLQAGVHILQLVAGVAIVKRWHARVAFAAYGACALATLVAAALLMRDDIGVRQTIVLALETVGAPVIVLVAPRMLGVTQFAPGRALAGILVVLALTAFISQPLSLVTDVLASGAPSRVGDFLGSLIYPAYAIGIGVLGLVAARRLIAERPARSWLRAYVIASIVGLVVLKGITVAYFVTDGRDFLRFGLGTIGIGLVVGIAKPVAIWWYANRELADTSSPRHDAALPWIALLFVPYLLGRCLLHDEVAAMLGSTLGILAVAACGAQAVANLLAAGTALRGDRASITWWAIAATVSLGVTVLVVYVAVTAERGMMRAHLPFAQLLLLFATAATAVWLRRRS